MKDFYFESANFLDLKAYLKVREIYQKSCNRKEGPILGIDEFKPISEDTLLDWIRQNTIPLSLTLNGQEIDITRGLYGEDGVIYEISSATKPLETDVSKKLIDLDVPLSKGYKRFARARVMEENYRITTEQVSRILSRQRLNYMQTQVSENVLDLFLLENIVKTN